MVTIFVYDGEIFFFTQVPPMPSHDGAPTGTLLMREQKHKSNNDGIDNDSKNIYKYVAVAAYFS